MVADLEAPEGAALGRALVERADIVLEDLGPAPADRLGLTAGRRRPDLAVVSISSFGRTGPYAGYKGEEIVRYAVGGPMSATGLAEREPLKLGGGPGPVPVRRRRRRRRPGRPGRGRAVR